MQSLCRPRHLFYAGLLALAVASVGSHDSRAGDPQPARSVNARELLKEVQIIGTLGKPLGELVTIRGTWRSVTRKDTLLIFEVTRIDGKVPSAPAEFADYAVVPFWKTGEAVRTEDDSWDWKVLFRGDHKPPTPRPGEVWKLMGAETGELRPRYSEQLFDQIGGAWMAKLPPGLAPNFDFIAMRRIDREAQQAPRPSARQRAN